MNRILKALVMTAITLAFVATCASMAWHVQEGCSPLSPPPCTTDHPAGDA